MFFLNELNKTNWYRKGLSLSPWLLIPNLVQQKILRSLILKIVPVLVILYQRMKVKNYFSRPFRLIPIHLDLLSNSFENSLWGIFVSLVHHILDVFCCSSWSTEEGAPGQCLPPWTVFFPGSLLGVCWVMCFAFPQQAPRLPGSLLQPQMFVGWISDLSTRYHWDGLSVNVIDQKKIFKSQWNLRNLC